MAKKKAIKKSAKKTTLKKGSAEAKRKMAKVRAAKTKQINTLKKEQLKGKLYQRAVKKTTTGGKRYKYNVIKDENLPAKKPGKRIAKKSGNVYYEYRVNRSDMPGSMTGIKKHYDKNSHNVNFKIVSGIGKIPNAYDMNAVTEIKMFIENDGNLYRQQTLPILKNLSKKYQKGTFDVTKASKLYRYLIDNGLQKYHKQFGNRGSKWYNILNTSDRQFLAEWFADETLAELQAGNIWN
jgi:hypothetical protein